MKKLGKCPYCDDGNIEIRKVNVDGKDIKVYACSNAKWLKRIDCSELSEDSTCSYSLFANNLLKFNKRAISEYEMRNLLKDEQIIVRLYRKPFGEYFKYAVLDLEFGIKVLFDIDLSDVEIENHLNN